MNTLILGTRGSELALAQAALTRAALEAAHPGLEIRQRVIRTTGDQRPDMKLSEFGGGGQALLDKGIFVKELEAALDEGTIDAAVHSLKDVPTELDERFLIAAVLPRAPVEDVLVFHPDSGAVSLATLNPGATVATSSVRRKRQLEWLRPDLRVADIRGNVPTRLRKLARTGDFDAAMLALAGLVRLGLAPADGFLALDGFRLAAEVMDSRAFLPAAGQGAVGIEALAAQPRTVGLLEAVDHRETRARVTLEREFLRLLKAGCQTPVGVRTEIHEGNLHASALVFVDHRRAPLRAETVGDADHPRDLAAALVRLLA